MLEDIWLCTKELARKLGLSYRTLENWRQRNMGPPYTRLGRKIVRYNLAEVREWQKRNSIQPS